MLLLSRELEVLNYQTIWLMSIWVYRESRGRLKYLKTISIHSEFGFNTFLYGLTSEGHLLDNCTMMPLSQFYSFMPRSLDDALRCPMRKIMKKYIIFFLQDICQECSMIFFHFLYFYQRYDFFHQFYFSLIFFHVMISINNVKLNFQLTPFIILICCCQALINLSFS